MQRELYVTTSSNEQIDTRRLTDTGSPHRRGRTEVDSGRMRNLKHSTRVRHLGIKWTHCLLISYIIYCSYIAVLNFNPGFYSNTEFAGKTGFKLSEI